jgi:UDP-glucose 4-epimerase
MINYLVTGGAGFVGSHLCERLYELGHSVTSLDNYFTGSVSNHISGVEYISGSTEEISYYLKDRQFDIIFHLGEYSRVEQSFDDINLVYEYNIRGTQQVLEYVRHSKAKLIYAGSSTKFAHLTDGYVMSPYAWSKATNTDLVKKYAEWYGIDYAITYFYNVYGKRELSRAQYGTLIAKYRDAMREGSRLPIVLPGTQLRNFTHIDDIVDALLLVAKYGEGDEYGIGNQTSYSVQEVAAMFGGPVDYHAPRRGNRMSAPVLTYKTQSLGWFATRSLPVYIEQLRNNKWNPI